MKYYGYFTDNHDCAYRQPCSGEDAAAKVEFNSLEDLYKYALYLCGMLDEDDEDADEAEELKNKTAEELEDYYNSIIDFSDGSPFLYYAEDQNGNCIYDAGLMNGSDYGEPDMVLDNEETSFEGHLDIESVPHKVIKTFYAFDLSQINNEDWDDEDEDEDWDDEDSDEDE